MEIITYLKNKFRGLTTYWKRSFGFIQYPGVEFGSYDDYWETREALDKEYPAFAELIENNASVLDVGCGEGSLLAYLEKERDIDGYGIDVSERAVELSRQRGLSADKKDFFSIKEEYDYVILREVIEHVKDSEKFIEHASELAKKGCIVSIPNFAFLPDRLRVFIKGSFPKQWVYHPAEHVRYWSVRDFRDWIQALSKHTYKHVGISGIQVFSLYRLWPNLFAKQCLFFITDED